MSVTLIQQRGDIAGDRAQLRLTNTAAGSVTVGEAVLRSPLLDGDAERTGDRTVTVAPGRTVDLPVQLPRSVCSTDADVDAHAVLTLDDGSATRTETADVDDVLGLLARRSETQCDRDAVESVARVEASAVSPEPSGTALLHLSIRPTGDGDGSVGLVALRATPLLRFPSGTETAIGLAVSADDPPSSATITVVPQRCDAHAIAEDKVGTLFDLVARVDGREVVLPLPREDGVTGDLLAFAAEACGLTPGS